MGRLGRAGGVRIITAAVALILVVWPALEAGATGEIVLTGRVALDHADGFPGHRSEDYRILETATERLQLLGAAAEDLWPGQRVRVRGHRSGGQLRVSPGHGAVTQLTAVGPPRTGDAAAGDDASAGSTGSISTASASTGSALTKRVAVLLINFVEPTPSPTPEPTPSSTPEATSSPTSSPASSPTSSPESSPTASPASSPTASFNPDFTSATPEPMPSPTTEPSSSATPSATPEPTSEPSPSVTPGVTPDPTPSPTSSPEASPTPTPTPTPTPPPQPWTVDAVRGVYFNNTRSVASYYAELSHGRMQITGDVFGWFTLAISTTTCDYTGWGRAARTAAGAAGIDLSTYTNIAYAFPKQASCWWPGMANLPGRHSWMNGTTSLFITSHELGHNFGVHHASSMTCTSGGARVQYSSKCSVDEYGDPFDVMGYQGQRHMANWRRWQLGFLSAGDVQTITGHGTYRMATAQVPGGVPRILRVLRPSGDYYYLEFRQPYGTFDNFSPGAAVVNGVTVRIAPDSARQQSRLLDANPSTTSFHDAAIPVGATLADPISQISITTLSIDPGGATVRVQVGPDTVAPDPPSAVTAEASADGSISLAWSPASDDVIVTGYDVMRDDATVASVSGTDYVDGHLAQGVTYKYAVVARDGAHNLSAPSEPVSIYLPDTTPPDPPAEATAVGSGTNAVELSWAPAVDNVGVTGYMVSRDGQALETTAATTATDGAAPDGVPNTYQISALDAAGNVGQPRTISVTLSDVTPPVLTGELGVELSTPTTVSLAWPEGTDNVGVVGYSVERDGTRVATATDQGFADLDVGQAQTYRYTVAALDAAGLVSGTLEASIFVPDTVPPEAPASVSALLSTPRSVDLSWSSASDNVSVDHYLVLRDGIVIGQPTATELTAISVEEGRDHVFHVAALDAAGNRSVAGSASVSVPDVSSPSSPMLSAATAGSTDVRLTWTRAADNVGVTGYVLTRDGAWLAQLDAATVEYLDPGLPSDRTYDYGLTAVDAAGNASERAVASATLRSADVVSPTVPTELAGQTLDRRWVRLTWQASTDDRPGTVRYQVFRGARRIATVTTLSHLDRPDSVGTYRYRVRAVDAAGNRSAFGAAVWVRAARSV